MRTIIIEEVGPRDGFQNLSEHIPFEQKIEIIDGLVRAGVNNIQVTSFVNPKAVPQMKDAKQIAEYSTKAYPNLNIFALVPNLKGAKLAMDSNIKKISFVISMSATHNKANTNRTHEQTLQELQNILNECKGLEICVDIATAFGCPFEGIPNENNLVEFTSTVYNMGIREVCFCDTVGLATPLTVKTQVAKAMNAYPNIKIATHFHDTRGLGIANSLAAIECNVNNIQTSLGGLGGCPFAPNSYGNTSTEDLVYALNNMGFKTGINTEQIIKIAKYEATIISGTYSGHLINL